MQSAQLEFHGRIVLVTGGVRGLGLAVARELARRGARVHIAWRSSAAAATALAHEFPGRIHQADLALDGAALELVERVLAVDGQLDCLVHAVGDFSAGQLDQDGLSTLRAMQASNVESALVMFDAARTALRRSHGSALFFGVAGLAGLRGRREAALYAAAKSALCVLVRSWALEEAPHGVRVNLLSPGIVPHAGAAAETSDPARAARVPLGRAGTPEEIAAAAAFLLGASAAYCTGVDLEVAGGWML